MKQKNGQKEGKKKSTRSTKEIIILALIIVFLLLLVFIALLTAYSKTKEDEAVKENRNSYETAIQELKNEQIEEGKIVPDRFNMIVRMYEGDVDTSQVYRDLHTLVFISIPDMQKKFKGKDNSEIENYYKDNKDRIQTNLGINNVENYLDLVNYVKDKELGEFVESKFDELGFKNLGDRDQVPVELTFTRETLTIIVEIDHEVSNINPIRFLAK